MQMYPGMVLINLPEQEKLLARSITFLLLICLFSVFPVYCASLTSEADNTQLEWVTLEAGLEICDVPDKGNSSVITILRIDPEYFNFTLAASGMEDGKQRTLSEWAKKHDLVAAINASMYLPDGITSTGYMRSGEYINNPKIVERFGAFFVSQPLKKDLPAAGIIEKDEKGWEKKIGNYDLVIQNYRMTNQDGRILWSPGGPLYSISAVAQAKDGKLLFLHSHKPVEAFVFVQRLLSLPLNIGPIMYVEGGAQAGLVIHSENLRRELLNPHAPSFLITGNINAVLPNILGIKRKNNSGKLNRD